MLPFEQWCKVQGLPARSAPNFADVLERLSGVKLPPKPAFVGEWENRARRRRFAKRFELWRRAVDRALDALRWQHASAVELREGRFEAGETIPSRLDVGGGA